MDNLKTYLLKNKIVSEIQLQDMFKINSSENDTIVHLYNEGILKQKSLCKLYDQLYNIQLIILKDSINDINLIANELDTDYCETNQLIPIALDNDKLHIAIANPRNLKLLEEISFLTGKPLKISFLSPSQIFQILQINSNNLQYSINDSSENLAGEVIQKVQAIIHGAIQRNASDIHIEPNSNKIQIRFRIDGVIIDINNIVIHFEEYNAIVSRIKIMGNMDISEKRLPQDGRILFSYQEASLKKDIDLRVSILPSIKGETIVLRILDKNEKLVNMASIGFNSSQLKKINNLLFRSSGMILTCGPTGSGKTTTLYAMLSELKKRENKILTIEDPVEYQMTNIQQIQVHSNIGLTFSQGLRSFLRHDPDIIMVGEIRDEETAEISVRSSLTGHMVLSTLHTNDAASSITRLLDMKVKPYLLASTLTLVISQRLLRKLCDQCKVKNKPTVQFLKLNNLQQYIKPTTTLFSASKSGCKNCNHSGFLGRISVFEIMEINEVIRKCILNNSSTEEINKAAKKNRMKTIIEQALSEVKKGTTSVEEVVRVIY